MSNFPPLDGSAPKKQKFDAAPEMGIDPSKRYTATMETSMGTLVIALDPIAAPITVNNFVFLAAQHYYDGVIFHRIINGFVCQGGDPDGNGRGGPGYRFVDELPKPGKYQIGSLLATDLLTSCQSQASIKLVRLQWRMPDQTPTVRNSSLSVDQAACNCHLHIRCLVRS